MCDKLYSLPPVKNFVELRELVLNNLRIDADELQTLNTATLEEQSSLNKSSNIRFLSKFLRRP